MHGMKIQMYVEQYVDGLGDFIHGVSMCRQRDCKAICENKKTREDVVKDALGGMKEVRQFCDHVSVSLVLSTFCFVRTHFQIYLDLVSKAAALDAAMGQYFEAPGGSQARLLKRNISKCGQCHQGTSRHD